MGRARALSETLATLETIIGVDFRALSRGIAGNIAKSDRTDKHAPPATSSVT